MPSEEPPHQALAGPRPCSHDLPTPRFSLTSRGKPVARPCSCVVGQCWGLYRREVASYVQAMSRPHHPATQMPTEGTAPPVNIPHWSFRVLAGVTVCGVMACSAPTFSGADRCEARGVAVARFAAATVALENVTRATMYRTAFDAGVRQDPNAVAEILSAAGLDPEAVQAAVTPDDIERALGAEMAAQDAFALGDDEAVSRAAEVMLDVVLDAVEAVEGIEARDALRPPLAGLFRELRTPAEVNQQRAAADSALRLEIFRAAFAVQAPAWKSTPFTSEADSTMREALDAAVRSALECASVTPQQPGTAASPLDGPDALLVEHIPEFFGAFLGLCAMVLLPWLILRRWAWGRWVAIAAWALLALGPVLALSNPHIPPEDVSSYWVGPAGLLTILILARYDRPWAEEEDTEDAERAH